MNGAYDLAVVGGGIFGAATARDAALRGLRVVLFEKGDVADATSSSSSKLVHGGVRYLEHFQFRLVRESLVEQERLLRNAPHLVRRRVFLVPDEGDWKRPGWYVGLGLRLYDLLAPRPAGTRSRRLSRAELKLVEPILANLGAPGATLYFDAQADDARLTLETLLDAAAAGAEVRVETEVGGLSHAGATWRVVAKTAGNLETAGNSETVHARTVVNAAGPWVDAVRDLAGRTDPPLLTWSRGAHILVPVVSRRHAFLLTARADRRVFFVVPHGEVSLVGTTESPHHGGLEDLAPAPEELLYLWRELAVRWPDRFQNASQEVRGCFAGVRALARTDRALGAAPRDEHLADEDGLISVAGGKYTTHRAIAERLVDLVQRRLGREPTPCRTRDRVLPGGAWGDRSAAVDRAEVHLREARAEGIALDWGERDVRRLAGRYGSRFPEVLGLLRECRERIDMRGEMLYQAEVVYAVRSEWARHLDDVVLRRLGLWRDRAVGRRVLEPVSRWMAAELGWSEPRRREEIEKLEARYAREEALLERLV